jgi:hypothetical protein
MKSRREFTRKGMAGEFAIGDAVESALGLSPRPLGLVVEVV